MNCESDIFEQDSKVETTLTAAQIKIMLNHKTVCCRFEYCL